MSFVTYKKVYDKLELDSFLDLLKKHAIPFEVEDVLRNFNPAMTPRDGSIEMRIKVLPSYFEEVKKHEIDALKPLLDEVEPDYYLFSFKDYELKDVIKNNSEWSLFDVLLAEKILLEKDSKLSPTEIESLKNEVFIELSTEKNLDVFQLIITYSITILLPFVGLIFGYFYMTHKQTLPNGEQKYVYDKQSRFHGKVIAILGTIQLIFIFLSLVFFVDVDQFLL
ncbi:MAG: hypothetical protein ACK46Y_05140 [Fluviicola sp.]|jgi:hypothetical protein